MFNIFSISRVYDWHQLLPITTNYEILKKDLYYVDTTTDYLYRDEEESTTRIKFLIVVVFLPVFELINTLIIYVTQLLIIITCYHFFFNTFPEALAKDIDIIFHLIIRPLIIIAFFLSAVYGLFYVKDGKRLLGNYDALLHGCTILPYPDNREIHSRANFCENAYSCLPTDYGMLTPCMHPISQLNRSTTFKHPAFIDYVYTKERNHTLLIKAMIEELEDGTLPVKKFFEQLNTYIFDHPDIKAEDFNAVIDDISDPLFPWPLQNGFTLTLYNYLESHDLLSISNAEKLKDLINTVDSQDIVTIFSK